MFGALLGMPAETALAISLAKRVRERRCVCQAYVSGIGSKGTISCAGARAARGRGRRPRGRVYAVDESLTVLCAVSHKRRGSWNRGITRTARADGLGIRYL